MQKYDKVYGYQKYNIEVGQIYVPADGSVGYVEVLDVEKYKDQDDVIVYCSSSKIERRIDCFKLACVRYNLVKENTKMNFELYKGDCLEVMKSIPDASVDAVICDPPYGTTACKWDSVIPFDKMWEQLKRVAKKDAAIVLFGAEPFSSYLRISNIEEFRYDWVWIKNRTGGAVTAKQKPLTSVENISVFYTAACTYNPIMVKRSEKELSRLSKNSICKNSTDNGVGFNKNYIQKREDLEYKYPRRDLHFDTVGNRDREKVKHPTQKPIALLEYLVKTYTNEGETVLDFTMGSGTAGVACANTNRNFIGIELDQKYFDIAKERIETAYNR